MSQRELTSWSAYTELYGSLSPVRRYDRGPALIAYMLAAVNGNKNAKLTDYMPWPKDETDIDPSADLDDQLMAMLAPYAAPPKD